MSSLPIPTADAQQHSQALTNLIAKTIQNAGGWINFAEFMHLALYAPSLGYYSAGSQKFGDMQNGGGDFVTAPQISPLFAQTIAKQLAQVLHELALKNLQGNILELGAGTGRLACDTLLSLSCLSLSQSSQLPAQYFILEVSDHLRQVQLEYLQKNLPADLFKRVVWLQALPENFNGVIIANEVLDALAVHIVHNTPAGLCERGIALANDIEVTDSEKLNSFAISGEKLNGFSQADILIPPQKTATQQYLVDAANALNLPQHYITEFCPAAIGLVASLADTLQHGAILLIDYGFSAREYYHPQRNQGTLMCHYQQLAHTNPLTHIGLQDITAHVDFTSIAHAGVNNGLALSGFCSQAQFLMNCGILDVMAEVSPQDIARYAPIAAAAQKLLSPAEMGDLFKVIGFTKGLETELIGFSTGDKSHTL